MAMETIVTPEMIEEFTSKGYWKNLTIVDHFRQRVKEAPERVAVIDREKRITYSELDEMSNRLAFGFLELGIKKQDIVCIQLPNTVEFVVTFFGLMKIGAVVVAFPVLFRKKEVDYILKLTSAPAFVIPGVFKGFDYLKMVKGLSPDPATLKHIIITGDTVPPGTHSYKEMLESKAEERYPADYLEEIEIDPNAVAQIVISAGTEAEPKGPMWSHNTICAGMEPFGEAFHTTEESVVFCAVPISSGFGGFCACFSVLALTGGTLTVLDRFEARESMEWIEKEKVTHLLAVSPQLISMMTVPGFGEYDTSSLTCWISFGAPLPVAVAKEVRSKMDCKVFSGYGSTDGMIVIPGWDDPLELVTEFVGRPVPGAEIKVLDDDGIEVPPGEVGELCSKGVIISLGYYGRPDLTEKSRNKEGWLLTGDLAYVSHNGNIKIVGRKKDIILRGAMNISAEEIEELLFTHPKVLNTSVVAMPDHRMGEKVCAYIVPKEGEKISLEEVVSFLREKDLAVYKLPERIELVNELPMTPAGKVQKRFLREEIAKKVEKEEG